MKSEQYKIGPKTGIVVLLFVSAVFGLPELGALSVRNENKTKNTRCKTKSHSPVLLLQQKSFAKDLHYFRKIII